MIGNRNTGATIRTIACVCLVFLVLVGGCSHDDPTYDIGDNDPNAVVAFGDSISAGEGSNNEQGYRGFLKDLFAADGRLDIRVIDEGRPGALSDSGRNRIDKVLSRDRPAVLIVLFGTNDEFMGVPQSVFAFTGTTTENLRRIVTTAREKKTLVVLSTVPPVCTESRQFQRDNIAAVNDKIRALAVELQAQDNGIFLADAWEAFLTARPPDGCELIRRDRGNHPNDAGYLVLAQTYYAALGDSRW